MPQRPIRRSSPILVALLALILLAPTFATARPLHAEHAGRASAERSEATPGLFAQLTWSGERLVGCSVNLAVAGVLEGTFAAFAAGHEGGPAYLHDLIYQPLQFACRHGISAIDLGSSALYPKVLRGARLRRRMVLVKGNGRLMHRVLRRLGRTMARRQEEKERRMLGALWSPAVYEDDEDDA